MEQGKGGKKQVSKVVVEREEGDVWIRSIFHKMMDILVLSF